MSDLTGEAAEAICAAIHQMPFAQFVGETQHPLTDELTTYFVLGEKPRAMRVGIARERALDAIRVTLEWANTATSSTLRGSMDLTLPTYGLTRADLVNATGQIVVRVLEVFKQVLEGTGVAGKIEELPK